MRSFLSLVALLGLVGCTTDFAAVGRNSSGVPVTGQLSTGKIDGKAALKVTVLTASHGTCTGESAKTTTTAVLTKISLQCSDGSQGYATITSDYINLRDTIDYRVGSEHGRITTGTSVQVAS